MADILDMVAYRQSLRQRRRFKKDLDECSKHPSLDHHPTWVSSATDEQRAKWAYGPEGLSDARAPESNLDTTNFDGPETAYRMGDDGKIIEVPVPGLPLADVVQLGTAKRASTLTGRYLDEILEKAYDGNTWAQFRLALIQLTDETPDEQIYIMQQTFPDMEVHQFEAYLERALIEFDEYSDLLEEDD